MPRIESRVEIDAPPATVFPWLVDPERLSRWVSGFIGSEPIGSAEVRVGSRSRDTIEAEGRRFEVETEIVEVRPGNRLAVRITSPSHDQTDTYDLDARDGSTELTYQSDMRFRGLMRLITPLITPRIRARAENDLATLKREVEADTAAARAR